MTESDDIQQLKTEITEHLYLEGIISRVSKRVENIEAQVVSIRNRLNRMQAELKDEEEEDYRIDQGSVQQVDPRLQIQQYLANLKAGQATMRQEDIQ